MKKILLLMILSMMVDLSWAQNNSDKGSVVSNYQQWRKEMLNNYQNFRKKMLQDYVNFLRNPWEDSQCEPPTPMPKNETVPPVVAPKEETLPVINNTTPVVIDEVVHPIKQHEQPTPVEPIREVPEEKSNFISFTYYGTKDKVRFPVTQKFSVKGVDENSVADAIKNLSSSCYDNTINDCLSIRNNRHLCDWAYLQMLREMSAQVMGQGSNESTLLMAYIYMQSGYRMRLAQDGHRLYMLYASNYSIYDEVAYELDGVKYYGVEKLPSRLYICRASYPKENSLSLAINSVPELDYLPAQTVTRKSTRTRNMEIIASANKNALDFYSTYPSSEIGNNPLTKWAMYANMPMPKEISNDLYPQLRNIINGLDQLTALNTLLNWIQTGFEYEYDDIVWGRDRAFFPEETLYYPYCDCEDRSIFFTRVVRDLLGLKCLLVYYPGHLAAAVAITEGIPAGDYIEYQGKRFYITDGTILGDGAPVGYTMPGMNNKSAKIILLD